MERCRAEGTHAVGSGTGVWRDNSPTPVALKHFCPCSIINVVGTYCNIPLEMAEIVGAAARIEHPSSACCYNKYDGKR